MSSGALLLKKKVKLLKFRELQVEYKGHFYTFWTHLISISSLESTVGGFPKMHTSKKLCTCF